jgi:flagellar biogenesis protein FliO
VDASLIGTLARLIVSLALVLGLMGGIAWMLKRRGPLAGAKGAFPVVARQQVGRAASVQAVRIGTTDRALVIGVTEASVTLLAEVDIDDVTTLDLREVAANDAPSTARRGLHRADTTSAPRPAGKSVIDTLRELTVRR